MDCFYLVVVGGWVDCGTLDPAPEIDFGKPGCIVWSYHQIDMTVWEFAPLHYPLAELPLRVGKLAGAAFAAEVQVVTEIMGVMSPVGLYVITKDDDPDVPAIRKKRLDNEGEGHVSERGLGKDLFGGIPEVNAHASVAAVVFGDHLVDLLLLVVGNGLLHVVQVVDGQGMRQHFLGKETGLEAFRTAGELREGRGEYLHSPLDKIKQEVFLGVFQANPADDAVASGQFVVLIAQAAVVGDEPVISQKGSLCVRA